VARVRHDLVHPQAVRAREVDRRALERSSQGAGGALVGPWARGRAAV